MGKMSASLMCADLMNVEKSVRELEKGGMDYFHIDIMDNHFVPNITLSPDFARDLKRITKVPLDVHLIVEKPEFSIGIFKDILDENDYLIVHYEASTVIQKVLSEIKSMGVKAGIALNPSTPIETLEYLLEDIDLVTVMTVNPGFAGQKVVKSTLEKIRDLRSYLNKKGATHVLIEVDGNVSFENAKIMHEKGADIFVTGTSSIFLKGAEIVENCRRMKEIITSPRKVEIR